MTLTRPQIAGAALALLLAGAGGYAIATFGQLPAQVAAPTEEHEEEAGGEHAGDALVLSPEVIRGAGIIVSRVQAGGLAAELLAPAVVTAPTSGQAVLTVLKHVRLFVNQTAQGRFERLARQRDAINIRIHLR